MDTDRLSGASVARLATLMLALLFAAAACRALPTGLMAPGSEASPTMDPGASPSPITKTMCESAADLRVDVDFLRSMEIREDGLVSVLVAVDAALGEARTLTTLVAQEYRPFAADLVLSLVALRLTVTQLDQQETVGASIAAIGEAIVGLGEATDSLERELQDPCPDIG